MNVIPYKIFMIILSIFKKNKGEVKAGNNSESLLNGFRQILCLYQSKQITEKVYNSIVKSM